ncbi:MAG: hypothetical protein K0U93_27250 [Gammaproteobacteria bacterium]|nr:hypothetical protein [Gammaproteobacteria bacterium]
MARCPWHPHGGCGFARHGTYERVSPPGIRVARWYCRKAGHTVSALPDCLAARRSGTLAQCQACVLAVEAAPSREAAASTLRTDIELPGALRYLTRLVRDVHGGLRSVKGLLPEQLADAAPTVHAFSLALGVDDVLVTLRTLAGHHLAQLPAPLGFNPRRMQAGGAAAGHQHRVGPDPPQALIDAPPHGACRSG